jgi:hypothetical protein
LPREENGQANALAQQASGYNVAKKNFNIRKPMRIEDKLQILDEPVRLVDSTGLTAQSAGSTDLAVKRPEIGIGGFL